MSKFNNIPNKLIKGVNGEEIWHSRSVCCSVILLDSEDNILVCLRGDVEDNPNKWCLPCGYLDWNEDIYECAQREIWEECGIYVDKSFFFINGINTSPDSDSRQNVSFRIRAKIYSEKPEVSNKNCELNEIDEVKWISISEVKNMEFAFNHDEIIQEFFSHYYSKYF